MANKLQGFKLHILLFTLSVLLASFTLNRVEIEIRNLTKTIFWHIGLKDVMFSYTIIDSSGIPLTYYRNQGYFRNPLFIARQAMVYYSKYETNKKDSKSYKHFFNCCKWLVNNIKISDSLGIYEYNFALNLYDVTPPWRCGLAQGIVLLPLVRASRLVDDPSYLNVCESILNAFFVEVKEGGITYKSANEGWWYEEYADEGSSMPRVLNGMISVVFALKDYYNHTGNKKALYLYNQGLVALEAAIHQYDKDGYSYYDMNGKIAAGWYHKMHISQLDSLYKISTVQTFKDYHDKWEEYYQNESSILQMIKHPQIKRIGVFLFFILMVFLSFEVLFFLTKFCIGILRAKK